MEVAATGRRFYRSEAPAQSKLSAPAIVCALAALFSGPFAGLVFEHTAANLVQLDRFEQRAEVSLAEPFVALALNDLEKDRTDHRCRENLQQHLVLGRRAIEEDAQRLEPLRILLVSGKACRERLVIGVRRILERDPA